MRRFVGDFSSEVSRLYKSLCLFLIGLIQSYFGKKVDGLYTIILFLYFYLRGSETETWLQIQLSLLSICYVSNFSN